LTIRLQFELGGMQLDRLLGRKTGEKKQQLNDKKQQLNRVSEDPSDYLREVNIRALHKIANVVHEQEQLRLLTWESFCLEWIILFILWMGFI